jgi:hypothetical protein
MDITTGLRKLLSETAESLSGAEGPLHGQHPSTSSNSSGTARPPVSSAAAIRTARPYCWPRPVHRRGKLTSQSAAMKTDK